MDTAVHSWVLRKVEIFVNYCVVDSYFELQYKFCSGNFIRSSHKQCSFSFRNLFQKGKNFLKENL